MKRKAVLIGAVLALLLGLVSPAVALAAKPVDFFAAGAIVSIDEGAVSPAGGSGRWLVSERVVSGVIQGAVNGPFSLTYKANVDPYQAGALTGRLEAGGLTLAINGKSQGVEMVQVWPGIYLPSITVNGNWTIINGQGTGEFSAQFVFIPWFDEYGNAHIGTVIAGGVLLTGQWQP